MTDDSNVVRAALKRARDRFAEYTAHHSAKGAHDKAQRNEDMVTMCNKALGYFASPSFQTRVSEWMFACFGERIEFDRNERNQRFIEEALELVQSAGLTREAAMVALGYVYDRPAGEKKQEIGGVMVTLAALCNAHSISLDVAAEDELARCWANLTAIREKQQKKPRFDR